ncbi:hypothetical protein DL93DRAFT_2148285 [Clavulina sp. PMI_390]|nr:hypothetical protein DL93DRAFT_2148285 [Clavulina sp. PMI_390]
MAGASEIAIRQVTQGIWTFSRPMTVGGGMFAIGGRSTAIKLASGDVWVLASTPLTDETKETLNGMGPVKYIVAANDGHYLFTDDFRKAYPDAKVIGTPGIVPKIAGKFKFDGLYGTDPADTKYGYESEIQACHFSGNKFNDVAFLHKPSKTMLQADLMMNMPATEQFSKTAAPGFLSRVGNRMNPYGVMHRYMVWSVGLDKDKMRRDVKTVAGWDFTRIIPCHGDVIEDKAKDAWTSLYKWYLE